MKDLDACYKKKRALPLLDGVNDLLLLIIICQFQRLLHWSSDLPHLSVKVDLPFLLINMKIATTTTIKCKRREAPDQRDTTACEV